MTYTLVRLAAGSYDVVLDGSVVASLVRDPHPGTRLPKWHVELLEWMSSGAPPAPFLKPIHTFPSYLAAADWLGVVSETSND